MGYEKSGRWATEERPWLQRKGEPKKAYERFQVYLNLKPSEQTYANIARLLGISAPRAQQIGEKYDWKSRAEEWNAEQTAQRCEAELEAIRDMHKRHIQLAMSLQGLSALEMNKRLKKAQEDGSITLTAKEIAEFIKLGISTERVSRGEPESILETKNNPFTGTGEFLQRDTAGIDEPVEPPDESEE
jgi:DNA-directed RNA polymerase specialized sigma subunit